MKEVVSVSLGSSSRDHRGVIKFNDEKILIRREGTDGDSELMIEKYRELDGCVDCLGAGGYIFGFHIDGRFYTLRTSKNIIKHIQETPIVDGTGVKETIERKCIQTIQKDIDELMQGKPKTALMTVGVDRYEMAQSLIDAEFDTIFGDLAFGLGIPIRMKSMRAVKRLARISLPVVKNFPLSWLYPVGEKQDTFTPKYKNFFENATLIAGDFLYIRRYAPMDMKGKIILTNTTTTSDIEEFKNRGVSAIITTTPDVDGRSFGTNGLEAAITAYAGLNRILTYNEMKKYVDTLGLKPQIIKFD